jgi:hypothetical protein
MFNKNYLPIIAFIILISAPILPAQNPNIIWMQIFGEGEFNCLYWVEQVGQVNYPDSTNFILAGCTKLHGQVHNDVLLIKTDCDGNAEWARTYGGSDNDAGFCVKPTSDSGFVVCGFFTGGGRSTSDGYIIKTDAVGDTVWTGRYGGSGSESFAEITQTSDGGYIAAGYITEPDENNTDVYVVKTDSVGEVMWSREYGRPLFADHAKSVLQTSDGGYIICGVRGGIGTAFDVWLIKTDSGGSVEWSRTYGGDGYDAGYSVNQTSDGGYIVAGYKTILAAPYHHDLYLVKTSSDGTVQWERTYGEIGSDRANSVRETPDGGLIAAGLVETPVQGGCDVYVVKTDGNGDLQWFGTMSINGVDVGYCVRQTDDGNFVIAGSAFTFDYIFDAFLMKISPGYVGIENDMSEFAPREFIMSRNYPNPFNTTTTIQYYLAEPSEVTIIIYDLLGRRVEILSRGYRLAGSHKVVWDADGNRSGIYFYRIEAGTYSETREILYLK